MILKVLNDGQGNELVNPTVLGMGGFIHMKTNLSDSYDFYLDGAEKLKWKNHENRKEFFDIKNSSNHEWRGGTNKDLNLVKNEGGILKKKKEILRSKSFQKLKSNLNHNLQRRRFRSEHDGEYDHDLRYEIKPFNNSKSSKSKRKTISIIAKFAFSARVSSENINDYGAFVCALTEVLESNGVGVELFLQSVGAGLFRKAKKNNVISVQIKKADEYLPKRDLYRCFTSNYYRRVVFSLYMGACELVDDEIGLGYGSPINIKKGVFGKSVFIDIDTTRDEKQTDGLLENLVEAIGDSNAN